MNRSRRLTSYFLIFLFGFLSIKNLFTPLSSEDNCLEFGHIHMTELHDTHEGLHSHDHGDEKCHEGKTLANHSLFPAVSYEFLPTLFKMEFDVVFNLDPHFKSPFLELDRKPPRA